MAVARQPVRGPARTAGRRNRIPWPGSRDMSSRKPPTYWYLPASGSRPWRVAGRRQQPKRKQDRERAPERGGERPPGARPSGRPLRSARAAAARPRGSRWLGGTPAAIRRWRRARRAGTSGCGPSCGPKHGSGPCVPSRRTTLRRGGAGRRRRRRETSAAAPESSTPPRPGRRRGRARRRPGRRRGGRRPAHHRCRPGAPVRSSAPTPVAIEAVNETSNGHSSTSSACP